MEDIRHGVGIDAPITDVYDAFATREGATRWWPDNEQIGGWD